MDSIKEKSISLILISFLGLFLELVFIRWLPANVLSLAYFSNIVLISAFLGLGLGCILASRGKEVFKWFPLFLLGAVALFISLRWFEVIIPAQENEWIWSYYEGNKLSTSGLSLGIFSALSIVYVINTLLFALIGQKVGSLMSEFKPIKAYSLDLIGSILGILAFGLLSFAGGSFNSPLTWFGIAGGVSLWFFRKNSIQVAVAIGCIVLTLIMINQVSKDEIWSPYYNIHIKESKDGSFALFVNKFFHQQAINFTTNKEAKDKYSLPYSLKKPKKVLILGAGTGNDVAIAAMNKVSEIHAVEIDPVIAELGLKHPNKPYQNPSVKLFIDDARSFLKRTDEKYDMVILGTLDSHALLSAMSTVRLDNFVYTVESLQEVKRHLNEKGIAVLMFSVPQPWLGEKLLKMASTVFDEPRPLAYISDPFLFNLMVVGGPGLEGIAKDKSIKLDKLPFQKIPEEINGSGYDLPSDDWPYLYLLKRTVPGNYVEAIIILLVLSGLGIWTLLNKGSFNLSSLNFFSLGSAFLLLETKSVTTLSLLFGSTWLVNAFVFGGILTMILIANLLVSRFEIKKIELIYVLLMAALLVNYILPINYFLGQDFWTRSILSAMIAALPIFFAAIIFSYHFKSVKEIGAMYGINLMGAVLGGFLEYSSMLTGLNSLYILAGGFYLLSFIAFKKASSE